MKCRAGVVADEDNTLGLLQGERILDILEENSACCANVTNNFKVVGLDINMFVVDFIVEVESIETD